MKFTISFAKSTGSTIGAKKFDGVFMSLNSGVPSCPGATSTVLMFFADGWLDWVNSALSDAWKANKAAFEAVYPATQNLAHYPN